MDKIQLLIRRRFPLSSSPSFSILTPASTFSNLAHLFTLANISYGNSSSAHAADVVLASLWDASVCSQSQLFYIIARNINVNTDSTKSSLTNSKLMATTSQISTPLGSRSKFPRAIFIQPFASQPVRISSLLAFFTSRIASPTHTGVTRVRSTIAGQIP